MKKLFLALLAIAFGCGIYAQQWNGLTYYSNMGSSTGRLVDTASVVVKTYTFSGSTAYSTHFMPGGNFVRSVQNTGNVLTGGGMSGRLQKLDYNGNILWDWTYSSSTYCTHHDHCVLPNGNILVISYDVKTAANLAAVGGTAALTSVWSEKVMELQPVGTNSVNVVWEWKVWDHLVQNTDPGKPNYYPSIVDHPELLNINYKSTKDWLHMNGIDYNPMLDQIIVSSHNLNEWYIIDHSTTTAEAASHSGGNGGKGGDFLYRWGNPLAYGATGTAVLNVTHDSHWIPEGVPGAGDLVGVNNKGVTTPSNKTTIDRVASPRVNYNYTITPGSAYSPATYDFRHTSTGYTSNMGNSLQFPNGNQMVCLATAGSIYEISPTGTTIWTLSTGGSCPQSHRYTTCYLNNAAPAQPSISLNGGDLVSTSGTTYQWYVNGNLIAGATSQSITPSQQGNYVVRTTDANGCVYVYSAAYLFGSIPTGISENHLEGQLEISPNPTNGMVHVKFNKPGAYRLEVLNMNGQLVHTANNATEIDLSNESNGIYFIRLISEENGIVTKKLIKNN